MQAKNDYECSHAPCMCPVIAKGEFCSDECKLATQSVECFCGHEPCLGDEEPALSSEAVSGGKIAVPA